MIQIVPSLLTNKIEILNDKLYKFLIFGSIDVDIVKKDFIDNETVQMNEILSVDLFSSYKSIGFHLMVKHPENEIEMLLNSPFIEREVTVYIQQEVLTISHLNTVFPDTWKRGICLKSETDLVDLDFYNNFDEVQFMTVDIGFQGNDFKPEVLNKVDRLRSLGYNKKVSVDGSVNLKSAELIKKHAIDRVSVGSYLSKAVDPLKSYKELNAVLNS